MTTQAITVNGKAVDITDILKSLDVMIVHGVARELDIEPVIAAAALRKTGRINLMVGAV